MRMRRARAWAEFAADPDKPVQLALAVGDVIQVLQEANQDGWGYGINQAGQKGYFPVLFVVTHVEDLAPSPAGAEGTGVEAGDAPSPQMLEPMVAGQHRCDPSNMLMDSGEHRRVDSKKADTGVAKQMDDLKAAEREAAARGDYKTAKELNSQYKALERQGQAAAAAAAAGAPSSAQKANAGAAKQMDDIKAAERAAAARGDYGAAMDLNKQYKAFESLQAAAGASLPAREDAAEASPRVQSAEAALKSSAALGRLQELRDVADDLQRKKLAAAVATKSTEERAAGMASEREELMEKAAAAQREIDAAKAAEKQAAERGDYDAAKTFQGQTRAAESKAAEADKAAKKAAQGADNLSALAAELAQKERDAAAAAAAAAAEMKAAEEMIAAVAAETKEAEKRDAEAAEAKKREDEAKRKDAEAVAAKKREEEAAAARRREGEEAAARRREEEQKAEAKRKEEATAAAEKARLAAEQKFQAQRAALEAEEKRKREEEAAAAALALEAEEKRKEAAAAAMAAEQAKAAEKKAERQALCKKVSTIRVEMLDLKASERAAAASGDYDEAKALAQQYKAAQDTAISVERELQPPDELVTKLSPLGFNSKQISSAYIEIECDSDEDKILSVLVNSNDGQIEGLDATDEVFGEVLDFDARQAPDKLVASMVTMGFTTAQVQHAYQALGCINDVTQMTTYLIDNPNLILQDHEEAGSSEFEEAGSPPERAGKRLAHV